MFAHSTIGGFSNGNAVARLSGIPFAGTLDLPGLPPDTLVLSSAQIKIYQKELNDVGGSALPPLTVDGIAGSQTYARVREFQRNNNLLETGAFDGATTALLTTKAFSIKNAGVQPTPILASGVRDDQIRAINLQVFNAIKSKRPDCQLSLDGLSIVCPDKSVAPSATDSLADWLPGGAKANALIAELLGATKDVATAGAKGFGQGFGATLPFAPLVYVGGAVVGIIILKRFF